MLLYEWAERVAQIVADAPPLTDEQRGRICALLRAGSRSDDDVDDAA
jgi:hypothetical protein